MEYLDIDRIHAALLDILKYFDAFCRRNGLRYSLSGGTMIGAVRHKGFIPWDDDADIMMPRPDYNRFLELFNAQSDGRYMVISHEIGRNGGSWYIKCYSKVEDTTTVSIEEGLRGIAQFGLNIDIFPVDGVPDNPAEQKKFCNAVRRYKRRVVLRQRPLWRLFQGPPLAHLQSRLHSLEYWAKKCDDFMCTYDYDTAHYAGAIGGLHGVDEVHPKQVFEEYADYDFEGVKLMGIKDAHAYLSKIFGDYMQLPPERERSGKHKLLVYYKDKKD